MLKNYWYVLIFLLGLSYEAFGKIVKVTWLDINYPSAYFLEGEYKNKGFAQVARKLFMENLPEYKSEVVVVNINRLLSFLQTPSNNVYCSVLGVELDQFNNTIYSNIAAVTICWCGS